MICPRCDAGLAHGTATIRRSIIWVMSASAGGRAVKVPAARPPARSGGVPAPAPLPRYSAGRA